MFKRRVILYHIIKHKMSFTQIAFSQILSFFQFKSERRTVRHDIVRLILTFSLISRFNGEKKENNRKCS